MTWRRLGLAAFLALGVWAARAAHADGLLIIANPSVVSVDRLTPDDIRAIYLLRMTRWPDGSNIVPVNLDARSDVRARFTASLLQQDEASLAVYWNEMHYAGKLPPVVQQSEAAMLAFVRSVPGAIGYVGDFARPVGVRVLARVP